MSIYASCLPSSFSHRQYLTSPTYCVSAVRSESEQSSQCLSPTLPLTTGFPSLWHRSTLHSTLGVTPLGLVTHSSLSIWWSDGAPPLSSSLQWRAQTAQAYMLMKGKSDRKRNQKSTGFMCAGHDIPPSRG